MKLVLKLDLHDDKDKHKAMRTVARIPGIDSISMDMKEQKMTVIGAIDPVDVVFKLRKQWWVEIFSVAPAKEPEKKGEAKKVEIFSVAPAKEPEKKGHEAKKVEIFSVAPAKETEKKDEANKDEAAKEEEEDIAYQSTYNPHMTNHCPVQAPFA